MGAGSFSTAKTLSQVLLLIISAKQNLTFVEEFFAKYILLLKSWKKPISSIMPIYWKNTNGKL